MTLSGQTEGALVGIAEIAEIAGVQRTAVSNWRKRNLDFPVPVVDTPSGLLFDLGEVERWLIEKGKIAQRVPIAPILWRVLDAIRGDLSVPDHARFISSALVYLEVSDRISVGRLPDLDLRFAWAEIRETGLDEAVIALRDAATQIEAKYPKVRGLILDGLFPHPHPTPHSVVQALDLLDRVTRDDEVPRFDLFEQIRDRIRERDRFSEEWATPHSLEFLLARLTTTAESIFDPACGEGGVLLMAGLIDGRSVSPSIHGWDLNQAACQLARTRFFLYDVDAEIDSRDSLRERSFPTGIEAVVLDPPYGMQKWGDATTYMSDRWRFGAPSPNSADMAWLQLAIEPLAREGRAFVILPWSSLYRGGRDEEIRNEMLSAHVVDALVVLPARLRRNTSIQVVLWCLRSERAARPDDDVLLIDASQLGTAGRSTVSLEEDEIESIVNILGVWWSRGDLDWEDSRLRDESPLTAVQVPSELLAAEGDLTPMAWYTPTPPDRSTWWTEYEEALRDLFESKRNADAAMVSLLADLQVPR